MSLCVQSTLKLKGSAACKSWALLSCGFVDIEDSGSHSKRASTQQNAECESLLFNPISKWSSMSKKFLFKDVIMKTDVIISKYLSF